MHKHEYWLRGRVLLAPNWYLIEVFVINLNLKKETVKSQSTEDVIGLDFSHQCPIVDEACCTSFRVGHGVWWKFNASKIEEQPLLSSKMHNRQHFFPFHAQDSLKNC